MGKRFLIAAVLLFVVTANAQEITSSPYSFYGTGIQKFKGTAENRAMGGLSVFSDSIHMNLQNPAGYGKLRLTTFAVGGSHVSDNLNSNTGSDKVSSTSLDYIAVGIPAGKFGFGFGVEPYTAVGYKLRETNENSYNEYTGRGGLNKLFLSMGYRFNENFRLGVEGSYNFGNIQNKSLFFQSGLQFGSREKNRSDLSGFKVNFGAQYEKMLTENLQIMGSASYSPSAKLNSDNTRQLATIALSSDRGELVSAENEIDIPNTEMKIPADVRLGAGIGRPRKWFAGVEYENIKAGGFNNRSFTIANASFHDATTYRVGGFFIPDYNDITSYFKRIVFRAGMRYGETGLNIKNKDIDEFGISFGAGLPAGRYLTNINLGVEYGYRGTKASNLVREDFLTVFISLSLNDKWFEKRKFN